MLLQSLVGSGGLRPVAGAGVPPALQAIASRMMGSIMDAHARTGGLQIHVSPDDDIGGMFQFPFPFGAAFDPGAPPGPRPPNRR
jgi:hypothetical protein